MRPAKVSNHQPRSTIGVWPDGEPSRKALTARERRRRAKTVNRDPDTQSQQNSTQHDSDGYHGQGC